MRYKRIGYNINVMRQSAYLVINPITVDGFASLFNCTPVGRASDSVMGPTYSLLTNLVGWDWTWPCLLVGHSEYSWWLSFAPVLQWYCFTPWGSPGVAIRFCRVLISDSS